jgi:SpoVK/Ycf46/Vps4 family AAA+-type ATPase
MDVPTIVINQPLVGKKFNSFLQTISQPSIILFDEFEKVYEQSAEQEAILTLLDGVYPSKKLFLLTCNDTAKINSNMKNRPGRLFYFLKFKGLDQRFFRECSCIALHNGQIHFARDWNFSDLYLCSLRL